eukprot:scaffold13765_cov64-Phaeocystis_antarctica.AAC.9
MLLELGDGNGTAAVLVVPAGPQAAEACVRVVVALRVRRWRRRRGGCDSCSGCARLRGCAAAWRVCWRGVAAGVLARRRGGVAVRWCGGAAAHSPKRSNRIRTSFFEYLRAGRNTAGQCAARVVWCHSVGRRHRA